MTLQNVAPRLSNTDKLRRFRKRVERCMRHKDIRPFTCSGSPYCCRIFIVGLNSATRLKPFFETYWSDDSGFLRDRFEEDYQKIRKKRGVRPRIEAFVDGVRPIPCLETNLYAVPTKRSSQLKLAALSGHASGCTSTMTSLGVDLNSGQSCIKAGGVSLFTLFCYE